MKKLFLIIGLAIATCFQVDAQVIKLIPDETYGQGNNWDKIFDTYYDTVIGRPYGLRKQLVVFDDGKAIVSHATRNRYSLFDSNGNFLKDITLYFADKGKKPRNLQPVDEAQTSRLHLRVLHHRRLRRQQTICRTRIC